MKKSVCVCILGGGIVTPLLLSNCGNKEQTFLFPDSLEKVNFEWQEDNELYLKTNNVCVGENRTVTYFHNTTGCVMNFSGIYCIWWENNTSSLNINSDNFLEFIDFSGDHTITPLYMPEVGENCDYSGYTLDFSMTAIYHIDQEIHYSDQIVAKQNLLHLDRLDDTPHYIPSSGDYNLYLLKTNDATFSIDDNKTHLQWEYSIKRYDIVHHFNVT